MSQLHVRHGVKINSKRVLPDLTPPPAPTGLDIVLVGTTATITAVDNSGGTAYHDIYRRRADESGGTAIDRSEPGEAISFADAGLPSGFTYFYSVRALFISQGVDVFSDATPEESVSVVPPVVPPNAPVMGAATSVTATSAQFNWSNVVNETGYELYLDTVTIPDPPPAGKLLFAPTVDAISHGVGGLNQGTTYFAAIRALNSAGAGPLSNVISFTTSATTSPPLAPVQNAPASITASSALIDWANVLNETGFEVYVSTATIPDPPPPSALRGTVGTNVTSLTVAGLTASTAYFSRVRAVNAGGPSPLSNERTFSTLSASGQLPFARWVHFKNSSRGLEVDASNSMDPAGGSLTYDVDWGDGSAHGTSVLNNHTYAADGVYNVRVTVTNSAGNTDSWARAIRITSSNAAVFSDFFETGHTLGQPPLANTQNGYKWKQQTGPFEITDEIVRTGTRSLRIRANPKPHGGDVNPELRFLFGEELTEFWVRQWVYIPLGNEIVGSPPRQLNRYFHRGQATKTLSSCSISADNNVLTTSDIDINIGDVNKEITVPGAFVLTGTVTSDGTTAIVGTGTSFLTQLAVGQKFTMGAATVTVQSIADNTHLTATAAVAPLSGATAIRIVTITAVDDAAAPFQITLSSNAISTASGVTAVCKSYGPENNKWMVIWPYENQYTGNNVLFQPIMHPVSSPDRITKKPGDSRFTITYEVEETPKALYKTGSVCSFAHWIGDPGSGAALIRGQFNEVTMHFRYARNRVVNDGLIEIKANGQLKSSTGLALILTPDNPLNLPPTRFCMHTLYFQGTANSGYNEETDFYYDGMEVWDVPPPSTVFP